MDDDVEPTEPLVGHECLAQGERFQDDGRIGWMACHEVLCPQRPGRGRARRWKSRGLRSAHDHGVHLRQNLAEGVENCGFDLRFNRFSFLDDFGGCSSGFAQERVTKTDFAPDRHGFDPADGRMWFHVTREGLPLRKRRYAFSEGDTVPDGAHVQILSAGSVTAPLFGEWLPAGTGPRQGLTALRPTDGRFDLAAVLDGRPGHVKDDKIDHATHPFLGPPSVWHFTIGDAMLQVEL